MPSYVIFLVHTHLLYAISLWCSTNPTRLTKLNRIQNKALQWYVGFRPPPYLNNSVFDQRIQAKNASEFQHNFGFRILGLGTKESRVELKRTPRSISRERKEPNGAKTHSADRFLIKEKRKATAQPDSSPKRERKEKKT